MTIPVDANRSRTISFERACRDYPHRYTMDHVPQWSRHLAPNGKHYAPQYSSDMEWYINTFFLGEYAMATKDHCYSLNQSWPLGQWLDTPYRRPV